MHADTLCCRTDSFFPPMEQHEGFDSLLNDALQKTDAARRDRALKQLLAFAERVAAARNPAHAESVAASAVASLHQKIARNELSFDTPAQLLAFLRRVAAGKAVDRLRHDRRHIGSPVETPGDPTAGDPTPSAIVDQRQMQDFVHDWLARFPAPMRSAVADHIVEAIGRLESEERLEAMQQLGPELEEVAVTCQRVLSLFPEVLRDRAAARIGRTALKELPALLLNMEGMMIGARSLNDTHRLVVEMREAGWEPKEIGVKLNLTAGNVRIIHWRLAAKLLGREESDETP